MFESQAKKNSGGFSKENLLQHALDLGLNREAFQACQQSEKYTQLIQEETRTGMKLGFRGTPSFLINGQALVGDQPLEAFEEIIQAELDRLDWP